MIELVSDARNEFQPLVLDLRSEMTNGFVYMKSEERMYFSPGTKEAHSLYQFLKYDSFPDFKRHPISTPHSSSFVDLNGDCQPDLVFTSFDKENSNFYIEYWLQLSEDRYELYNYTVIPHITDPKQISLLIIADFGIALS